MRTVYIAPKMIHEIDKMEEKLPVKYSRCMSASPQFNCQGLRCDECIFFSTNVIGYLKDEVKVEIASS